MPNPIANDQPPSAGKPRRRPTTVAPKIMVGNISAHQVALSVELELAVTSTRSPTKEISCQRSVYGQELMPAPFCVAKGDNGTSVTFTCFLGPYGQLIVAN